MSQNTSHARSLILSVSNLSKTYVQPIFTKLNFDLHEGEVLALVGQNGSGKTTLLNCISGLIPSDAGSVRVCDYSLQEAEREVRRRMVFVPDVPSFYPSLTAWEHLRFMAASNEVLEGFEERAERLLKDFGLWFVRHQFPHNYSRGMRLKLGLVMGLIRPARLLLFDEPVSALDVDGREVLIAEIKARLAARCAVVYSSHDAGLNRSLNAHVMQMPDGQITSAESPVETA